MQSSLLGTIIHKEKYESKHLSAELIMHILHAREPLSMETAGYIYQNLISYSPSLYSTAISNMNVYCNALSIKDDFHKAMHART